MASITGYVVYSAYRGWGLLFDVPPLDFGPERMEALRDIFDRFQFGSLPRRLSDLADGGAPVAAAASRSPASLMRKRQR